MKKALAFLTTIIFVAGLAGGASAAAHKAAAKGTMKGQHTMSGTVRNLDRQTGMVSLNTDAGELRLHFPPQALQNVKEGDTITVSLALQESAAKK